MRHLARALAVLLVAGLALVAPDAAAPVSAATAANPKVAIIVGATHGTTPTYRKYADEVYAEAIKYTSNVVRVYSPRATWAAVKAATNGASIVVYLGHGNGFPSPYGSTMSTYTKNGFGLNADTNGDGKLSDYENKYYGEYYIGRELAFAPNAVVLLLHLCYASGNSEPGHADPTVSVARQRVDNYAAGFLRAGARAVIADGHIWDHGYYIRALFSTRRTIEQVWRGAPTFADRVSSYASSRTPGATYKLDPKSTGKYYHSIAGWMDLRTEDVTGARYATTDVDPGALVVPGAATAGPAGAPLYPDAPGAVADGPAPAVVPAGTNVRTEELGGTAVDGSAVVRVRSFDGTLAGWTIGSSLVPRDSEPPRLWSIDDGTGAFSPNGDGARDTHELAVRLSEPASWTVRFADAAGTVLATRSGSGDRFTAAWDGLVDGKPVADGAYRWTLEARDAWGNAPLVESGSVTVDTVAPTLGGLSLAAASTPPVFSPNGDGVGDAITLDYRSSEPGTVGFMIKDASSTTKLTASSETATGAGSFAWDGRDAKGVLVPDGRYAVTIRPRDRAGNTGTAEVRSIAVYAALTRVTPGATLFFPQDRDGVADKVSFSFGLLSPATVTMTINDMSGGVVRTVAVDKAYPAGTHRYVWDGTNDAGAVVPRGRYRAVVRATDGTLSASTNTPVLANAFRIAVSDTTPARGQRITVTITSAEALTYLPRVAVFQPGRSAWSARFSKVSGRTYRVTLRLLSSRTGTLKLKVYGTGTNGKSNVQYLSLPLH